MTSSVFSDPSRGSKNHLTSITFEGIFRGPSGLLQIPDTRAVSSHFRGQKVGWYSLSTLGLNLIMGYLLWDSMENSGRIISGIDWSVFQAL